jgi:hypothetical protein
MSRTQSVWIIEQQEESLSMLLVIMKQAVKIPIATRIMIKMAFLNAANPQVSLFIFLITIDLLAVRPKISGINNGVMAFIKKSTKKLPIF